MKDELYHYYSGVLYNNELYHYGVPGMRWGKRKAKSDYASLSDSQNSKYKNNLDKNKNPNNGQSNKKTANVKKRVSKRRTKTSQSNILSEARVIGTPTKMALRYLQNEMLFRKLGLRG